MPLQFSGRFRRKVINSNDLSRKTLRAVLPAPRPWHFRTYGDLGRQFSTKCNGIGCVPFSVPRFRSVRSALQRFEVVGRSDQVLGERVEDELVVVRLRQGPWVLRLGAELAAVD